MAGGSIVLDLCTKPFTATSLEIALFVRDSVASLHASEHVQSALATCLRDQVQLRKRSRPCNFLVQNSSKPYVRKDGSSIHRRSTETDPSRGQPCASSTKRLISTAKQPRMIVAHSRPRHTRYLPHSSLITTTMRPTGRRDYPN